jgi:transposase
MRLTDKQWEKIQYLVPDGPVRSDGKGRPWKDKRQVLEGILWIVKTGARWRDLPGDYPAVPILPQTFSAVGRGRHL